MVKNKNKFRINSEIHSINTRNNSNFHQLLSLLAIYHKCPLYTGIKIYNSLPPKVEVFSHNKKCKSSVRTFLHQHSFMHWTNISIIKQLYDIF